MYFILFGLTGRQTQPSTIFGTFRRTWERAETIDILFFKDIVLLMQHLNSNQTSIGSQGCSPFTKTIRLEISGIKIKHLNAMLRERELQKSLSTSARET